MAKQLEGKARGGLRAQHHKKANRLGPRRANVKIRPRAPLELRLEHLNQAFEDVIDSATCDELDAIADLSLGWCAELAVIHQPEIPDDAIENVRLIFPLGPAARLFEMIAQFHSNNPHLTTDEICAFVEQRIYRPLPAVC